MRQDDDKTCRQEQGQRCDDYCAECSRARIIHRHEEVNDNLRKILDKMDGE